MEVTAAVAALENGSAVGYSGVGNVTTGVDDGRRSLLAPLLLGVLFAVMALVTVLGNALVCVTVARIRRLRTATNFLILSLAACDLLLGCLVLPFSAVNTLLIRWPLGPVFCNLYVCVDVMLCTVSILNLFAISLDRYVAVMSPLRYAAILTPARVAYIVGGVWTLSGALAFVPIQLGWNTRSGAVQNYAQRGRCAFDANPAYALLVAGGTYFAPLGVMCAVYVRVLRVARSQVKSINQLARFAGRITSATASAAGGRAPAAAGRLASDNKATVTLVSVVVAFTLCWVPYFALFAVRPFLAPWDFPSTLNEFVLWLGYANSMLNPFLYAFHSREFRHAFLHVLCRRFAERYAKLHPDARLV